MKMIKKVFATFILLIFAITPVLAETAETAEFRKNYGTVKTIVKPRGIDQTAVNLSKQYAAGKNTPKPIMGQNGAVVYQYGSTVVRVICRTLRITDIELEEGETVTSAPFIGDSINWQVLPSASGSGDQLKYHIMIKPSMPDLSTNLVVHTDRRSYHFELVSSKTDHTPLVKFSYPQMQTQQGGTTGWQEFIAQRVAKKQAQENEYRVPYFDAGTMDDDYVIQGNKRIKWFPKRVYTDGIKTYIEFNNNLSNVESPVFMIVRNNLREMVNYRQIGNIFVVDYLFDVGILLAGSGGQQQKVVIRRVTTGRKPESLTEEYVPATMTETDENGKVIDNYVSSSTTTTEKTYDEIVAERKAKEEAEAKALAKAEARREASEANERAKKEKILRERLAKLEARKKEREAQAEAERKAREAEEAEKAKELAEKQAHIEAEEKRLEEAKRRAEEEAERKAKAAEERARKEAEAREKALAKKQARIEAEQKRLAEEKARAAEAEKARKEAEEAQAKAEAEQKAKLQEIQKRKIELLKRIEEIQKNRQN